MTSEQSDNGNLEKVKELLDEWLEVFRHCNFAQLSLNKYVAKAEKSGVTIDVPVPSIKVVEDSK